MGRRRALSRADSQEGEARGPGRMGLLDMIRAGSQGPGNQALLA